MEILKNLSQAKSDLPPLAYPAFLSAFNGAIDYGYFFDNNKILPFILRKKIFIRYLELPINVINCTSVQEEKLFLNKVIEFARVTLKIDYIISANTCVFHSFPTGSQYCKWGTYIVDLSQPLDVLFASLHVNYRRDIRRAERDLFTVSCANSNMGECCSIINDTLHRQGYDGLNQERINNLTKLGENIDFWIVKDIHGDIHGSAIIIWSKFSSYYMYGGSKAKAHVGAIKLMHWQAMLKMKERGVRLYNFVGGRTYVEKGSKLEGIQSFKSKFGSYFDEGFIWKYIFSPCKYHLYKVIIILYFSLKGIFNYKDAIDDEISKGHI